MNSNILDLFSARIHDECEAFIPFEQRAAFLNHVALIQAQLVNELNDTVEQGFIPAPKEVVKVALRDKLKEMASKTGDHYASIEFQFTLTHSGRIDQKVTFYTAASGHCSGTIFGDASDSFNNAMKLQQDPREVDLLATELASVDMNEVDTATSGGPNDEDEVPF